MTVKEERWHARHAGFPRSQIRGAHFPVGEVPGQESRHRVPVQAGLGSAIQQNRMVADVAPFGEVSLEHRLHRSILVAVLAGKPY